MKMTLAEITKGLTQFEYERLLSRLAGAIRTQKRFITIESAEQVNVNVIRYTVKRQGSFYPYLIEEQEYKPLRKTYLNLGLVI